MQGAAAGELNPMAPEIQFVPEAHMSKPEGQTQGVVAFAMHTCACLSCFCNLLTLACCLPAQSNAGGVFPPEWGG